MNMKRVLVIWDEFPSDISLLRMDVAPETMILMRRFHNCYLRSNMEFRFGDHILKVMHGFFYNEKGLFRFEKTFSCIEGEQFDLIIQCGIKT